MRQEDKTTSNNYNKLTYFIYTKVQTIETLYIKEVELQTKPPQGKSKWIKERRKRSGELAKKSMRYLERTC